MLLRQLPAAVWRSAGLSSNCTSFSASAKVDVETGGPASGDVPKAGGAPGVVGADSDCVGWRQATEEVISAAETPLRNCRRELDIVSTEPQCKAALKIE
jgi:hypothetical protein